MPFLEGAGLAAIVVCAGGLRLWNIQQNGYGNQYYAAAVRSGLESPSNLFFGSFDPAGFVTIDKPPGALWIQAASATLFGFSGPSLLVPQAIMGILSALIIYLLVRRLSGPVAAFLAGLILAFTPVSVAVDRDNLPDSALVFVLVLAAWALSRAIETGRLRPLLVSAAIVGVGFNVKMLAAFVVLPAFYLVYLVAGPGSWRSRIGRLSIATAVLVAVSLSWATIVDLTPPERRPYVGGSTHNSAYELAMGYNGLGRVFGGFANFRRGRREAPPDRTDSPSDRPSPPDADGEVPGTPPSSPEDVQNGNPPGTTGFGPPSESSEANDNGPPRSFGAGFPRGGFGGVPGALRFASPQMAGQITWLFPFAVFGAVVAASRARWRPPGLLASALVLWGTWLVTHWAVFSWAQGIFHEYYTTVMAPALAALVGIGIVILWGEWFQRRGWRGYFLPLALGLTTAWQALIIGRYPEEHRWLLPCLLGATGIGMACILAGKWLAGRPKASGWCRLGAGAGLTALLLGPSHLSIACALRPGMGVMPGANPMMFGGRPPGEFFGRRPFQVDPSANARLVEFLRANRHGERILVAAQASMEVAPIIIATGEPAVSLGGFMGRDPILHADDFARLVEQGQVRFVLAGERGRGRRGFGPPGSPETPPGNAPGPWGGGPPPGAFGNSEIIDYVRKHGKLVDPRLWRSKSPPEDPEPPPYEGRGRWFRPQDWQRLYDCRPEMGLVEVNMQTDG
jgi:4-amino-4-deoxy-L-arabinose transferase-like glycosyltransferase